MANDILLFRARRVLGLTGRRWRSLGRRALLAAVVLAAGLVASRSDLERGVRLAGDLWGWARYQTLGKVPAADGALSRAMPVCRGAVRRNCVIDGDTVWVDGEKIRLSGIDAPEIEGRCGSERALAQRATRRLSDLLSAQPFSVARSGSDRYGRTLGALLLRDDGDAGAVMLREGLARPWTGRRLPWC